MINISSRDWKEIISEVGYPVVKESDLEFSKQDIEDLFIYPALRDYFTYFPKVEEQSVFVENVFEFSFPDSFTFGLVDGRLNTTFGGSGTTNSPFMNEILYHNRVSGSTRAYGTKNDYGLRQAEVMDRLHRRTAIDSTRTFNINVNTDAEKVSGYTNVAGELVLKWAKFSEDFEEIPFRHKSEVLILAKSYTLRGFAQLRKQISTETGADFDVSGFEDRAQKLEEEVTNKWNKRTKVVILRN